MCGTVTRIELASLSHPQKCIKILNTSNLDNPTSLPDSEIDRGPEHASKVKAGPQIYYPLQGKFEMMKPICTSGEQENSLEQISVQILKLINSGQRFIKEVFKTQTQQEHLSTSSKSNPNYQESTTGLPKGSNFYGDGVPILGYRCMAQSITKVGQAKRSISTKAAHNPLTTLKTKGNSEYESGRELLKKLKVNKIGKFTGLYKLVSSKEFLLIAYNKLKSKSGITTPGMDKETIDGTHFDKIESLSQNLINESFQFSPVNRIWIPNKKNNKLRPLGIPKFTDKLVQEAIRTVLELIYDNRFRETSHGFRPKISTHCCICSYFECCICKCCPGALVPCCPHRSCKGAPKKQGRTAQPRTLRTTKGAAQVLPLPWPTHKQENPGAKVHSEVWFRVLQGTGNRGSKCTALRDIST
jgi:hypothetical protein